MDGYSKTEIFNQRDFEEFVKNKIVWLGTYKNSLTKEQVINAVCQFDKPIKELLNKSNPSYYLNKIFDLSAKPVSVRVNDWFLFLFGFKYCSTTKLVLSLDSFSSDSKNWDGLRGQSKLADGLRYDCLDKQKLRAIKKVYRDKNKTDIAFRRSQQQKNNRAKLNSKEALRRANKFKATPKWVNLLKINTIYTEAKKLSKETGVNHQVDHIIPLQGKYVCGLHVEENLQIISISLNRSKSNYHESEEYWK